ncbi:MAG: DUF86 domain-containing protein [Proteobacteria bacterium]|nr:DUF86 domain-containing protein [Pseudomonadota bacterium]MDA1300700.1 DUF86 domain-containing protein [Pseudomonadota bacterium]
MDRIILTEKMESLRRCMQRIEARTPGNVEMLRADPDLQDILVLNLTRAVQLCVDIGSHIIGATDTVAPTTMGEVFDSLHRLGMISASTSETMKRAVGFRNIAVHNYQAINWEIVFAICTRNIQDFSQFVREIERHQPH